ncbi:hypothetical protein JCM4814A_36620 [Streptomyces phaeofaciens JCM 4814]|uniref:Uncharacterized protein n=1 Tax=Streptomyces phaeofaciens TaxID=68254 RepID=A0A918HEX0_9ACTN|nr:hypothetical protein GCM10010226_40940 [Streptomyces phaeofaciens]
MSENKGLAEVPPTGAGKSERRLRQLDTAARVTPANRAISAAVAVASAASFPPIMKRPYTVHARISKLHSVDGVN